MPLGAVAVFCGSSLGKDPRFQQAAKDVGQYLGKNNIELVYGGGLAGLMGVVAESASDAGGKVTGYIPEYFLNMNFVEGWSVHEVGQTVIVQDMHVRKKTMLEKADALIALPGGCGTMDELLEVLVQRQFKLHNKPVGIVNVGNYFGGFLDWLDHAVEEEFVTSQKRNSLLVAEDCETLMHKICEQLMQDKD